MRYTLRQLEVFLAVARAGGVNRAARGLHLSQSATSSALSDLEDQFDARLFERVGRRLQLSALGLELRPRAEALLDQAAELERLLAGGSPLGTLRIGATLTIGEYLAPHLMARYLRAHPQGQVALAVANTEAIATRLANFEIDIGLIEGEVAHPELETLSWCKDELVVFCARRHPLAGKRWLTDEDLAGATWILRERGSGTRQTFERAMTGLLPRLNIGFELQHTEAIKGAVAAGLGLGCISRVALAGPLKRGEFKACPVRGRDLSRQFLFLLHKRKHRSPALAAWIETCRAARPLVGLAG